MKQIYTAIKTIKEVTLREKAGKCRLSILSRFCLVSLILMTIGIGEMWGADAWTSGSGSLQSNKYYAFYNTSYNTTVKDGKSHTITLNAPCKSLTVDISRAYAIASQSMILYYSNSTSGDSDWTKIGDCSNISKNGSTYSFDSSKIPVTARRVKFQEDGGLVNKYINSIKAEMADPFVTPSVDEIDFGTSEVGDDDSEESFTFLWNNNATSNKTLTISSDASKISFSSTSITATKGSYGNTDEITVTYTHDEASDLSGKKIYIKAGSTTYATITLKGSTARKSATMGWNAETDFMNPEDEFEEAAWSSDDSRPIKYSTSNSAAIKINEDGYLEAVAAGSAEITAYQEENTTWAYGFIKKTITVTNKQKQSITWTDKLSYKYEGANVSTTMHATAPGGTVTYSVNPEAASWIEISGSTLIIKGKGTAYITATQEGNDTYVKVSLTRKLISRNPNDGCDDSAIDDPGEFSLGALGQKTIKINSFPASIKFKAYKTMLTAVGDLVVEQKIGNDWSEVKTISVTELNKNSYKSFGPFTLNRNASNIRFSNNGSYKRYVDEVFVSRASFLEASVDAIHFDAQAGARKTTTFTIDYSNIQAPLSITASDDTYLEVSPEEMGEDCGDYGTKKTITVVFKAGGAETVTGKNITITDGKNLTLVIPVTATVSLNSQQITWNNETTFYTTDSVALTATASSTLPITSYTSKNTDIARISQENNLWFLKSGEVDIDVYQEGNHSYDKTTKTQHIIVNAATPTIVTTPTGAEVTYLQTLENSTLTTTNALAEVTLRGVEHSEVAGGFAWTEQNKRVEDAEGKHSYEVTFTPTDGGMYTTQKCSVEIQVNKANQTLVMKDSTVYVKVNGLDANAANSRLNLNDLIKSQTIDPVKASRAGNVTYEVISDNKANASIDGSTFTAIVCDTYTVRATKDGTDYYNAVTDDFDVVVVKRTNTLAVVGAKEKYVDENVTSVASFINSDAQVQTSSTAEDIARYDVASNKIVIDNRNSASFNDTVVTISIWQEANSQFKASGVKTIEVKVKKYDNKISYTWDGEAHTSWSETLHFDKSETVVFSATNTQAGCPKIEKVQTFGQDNATYIETENKITASHNVAYATWKISQAESRTYQGASATLTVNVTTNTSKGCDLYASDWNDGQLVSETHIPMPEVGTSGELDFEMKKHGSYGDDALLCLLVGTKWDTIHIWAKNDYYGDFGAEKLDHTSVKIPIQLNPNTTAIRFDKYATSLGSLTFDDPYVKNVRVTRKTWLKLEDADKNEISTLVMPTNTVSLQGSNSKTAKFYINYSTCDNKVHIASNNSSITVNVSEFDIDHLGRKEVTVSYTSSKVEEISAIITVYTQYENQTLTVTAKTEKENQSIIWEDGYKGNPLTLPVGLNAIDAASSTSHYPVTYTSKDETIIKVSADGLSFQVVGAGTTTLTAEAAGDETHWKPVSETKTIHASAKKVQQIVWTHDYTHGLHPGETANLDAIAMVINAETGAGVKSDSLTALIAYEPMNNNGVISISGKTLTLIKEGDAQIKATLAGSEEFETAEPVILNVHVRVKSTGDCGPEYMFKSNEGEELGFYAFTGSLTWENGGLVWRTPELVNYVILNHDITSGDPDTLTYSVRGKAYHTTKDHFQGTIEVWQSIDGGSNYTKVANSEVIPVQDKTVPSGKIVLDHRATHLKFVRPADGQGYHYVSNIKVTRLAALTSENTLVNGLPEVNLGDVMAGAERSDVITFTYASVKGDLNTSKQNSTNVKNVLTINEPVIELDCGAFGTRDLPITFQPMEVGAWSEEVKITDPLANLSYTVRVKANVTQGAQTIIWNPETKLTFGETVALNAYATSGLDVSYEITSGTDIAKIVGDKIVMSGIGNFTVVVSQAGNNSFAAATLTRNFKVENDEIVFFGDGNWTETNNWQAGQKPTSTDDVKVTGQLTISSEYEVKSLTIVGDGSVTMVENGKLTINGDTKETKANEEYGDLHVYKGGEVVVNGDLKVKDFYLESVYPTTSNAKSGQVEETINGELDVKGNAYFDLTLDPIGYTTYGWYDISVPFVVDASNGVFKQTGEKLAYGSQYAIIEFDEAAFSANKRGWKYCRGEMQPGKLYSISMADGINELRFMKKDGSSITAQTKLAVASTAKEDADYQGWNGLGNTALQHAKINHKTQIYNHDENKYVTMDANECSFVVGAAFFVQVEAAGTVDLKAESGTMLRAAQREGTGAAEFMLTLDENGKQCDRLFVSAEADAVNEYEIGHDLVKFGTPTESKSAQIWADAYGMKLCDIETPLNEEVTIVDVTMFAPKDGEYSLSIAKNPDDQSMYLMKDNMIVWNLTMGEYTLDLTQGLTDNYKLMIYRNPEVTTDIDNINRNEDGSKLIIGGHLYIFRDGKMFDAQGRSLK